MLRFAAAILLLLCRFFPPAMAQTPIRFVPSSRVFILDLGKSSYVFGINEKEVLQHIYWGGRVQRADDFPAAHTLPDWSGFDLGASITPEEYPAWGAGLYVEPGIKATFSDGNRDVVLHYAGHHIANNTLNVTLKDIERPLFVHLHYTVYPGTGVLRRDATIENRSDQPVVLESAQSAAWSPPDGEGYRLRYLTGRWAGEWQLNEEPVHTGVKVLESRRGTTSVQANPWFALDRDGNTDSEHGSVWFGALGWSGSWRISIEQTPHQQIRVTGGVNSFDFAYRLTPGESLVTPPFYAGYTDGGIGEASRILHAFERNEILPHGSGATVRPVLFNSYYATGGAVNEPGQKALAQKAASLGVERFVMDAGWFDHLGDWNVDRHKFPNGLGPLIRYVKDLGMDFGLWVEPETISLDSDLYHKHPEWAMRFAGRPLGANENRVLLNMARDDVKEYTLQWLDRLVTDNNIKLLKWDYNLNFVEPGWPEAPVEEQKSIYVRYTKNLYEILDRLRQKHPGLEIEACSGGGGRVDLGILRRSEQVWPSDNTEAFDRLTMQQGFTYAYTPHVMMDWVTDIPNFNGRSVPLQFRFLVAMQGALAIGNDLNRWQQEDFATAKQMIGYYKTIRETVQNGALYRLQTPSDGNLVANEYVSPSKSKAVLFVFLHSQRYGRGMPPVLLRGLDETATYRISRLGTPQKKESALPEKLSGAYLLQHGLMIKLQGDYDSASIKIDRISE